MIAATNRPDILDPALLRPGRFDRQIVVPLPDLEERLPILQVHCKGKRMASDVDLSVVAHGTPRHERRRPGQPGQRGRAARRAPGQPGHRHGRLRDGAGPGPPRPAPRSMVLSEAEKERVAYHEGGHALLAYVLEHADPVHKVTILPDRHGSRRHPPAPDGGAPHPPPRLHRGLALRPHGRPRGRAARLRRPVDRRRQRPRRQHGARPQDGPRVGHERGHRPHGVGLGGPGVPRRGPHAHA